MAMITLILLLIVFGSFLSYLLIDVARTLRRISARIEEILCLIGSRRDGYRVDLPRVDQCRVDMKGLFDTGSFKSGAGYAVWVFRGGSWTLVENECEEGYEPGSPPAIEAPYEGYRVRQEGVPRRG